MTAELESLALLRSKVGELATELEALRAENGRLWREVFDMGGVNDVSALEVDAAQRWSRAWKRAAKSLLKYEAVQYVEHRALLRVVAERADAAEERVKVLEGALRTVEAEIHRSLGVRSRVEMAPVLGDALAAIRSALSPAHPHTTEGGAEP